LSVTPTTVGAFSFEVIVDNDDANENPYDWMVSGTALGEPEISVSQGATGLPDGNTDSLGSRAAGQATTRVYAISNVGTATLNITPVVIGGQTNCIANVTVPPAATVAPATTTQLEIMVTPAAAGPFSFSVSIVSNDADESPYDFDVSGTATAVAANTGGASGGGSGCAAATVHTAPTILALIALAASRRRKRN
jgi:hypothetical protein